MAEQVGCRAKRLKIGALSSFRYHRQLGGEALTRKGSPLGGSNGKAIRQLSSPNQTSLPLEKRRVPRGAPAGSAELIPQASAPQESLGMLPNVLEVSDEVEVREELVQPEI